MKILSTDQMRELDKKYMEIYGISQEVLMENAALSAFYLLKKKELISGSVIIFCGPGNNGGDGLALARKLFSYNTDIKVYLTHSPDRYEGASMKNYKILKKLGTSISSFDSLNLSDLRSQITEDSVIIDALLGTGLTSDLRSPLKEAVEFINSVTGTKLSLDISSGLSSDTGCSLGDAVLSHMTISFGFPKYGHFIGRGRVFTGDLYHCNISIPEKLTEDSDVSYNLPQRMIPRDPLGHKGSFGRALFISGSDTYLGAPYFTSYSFIQCGGGYSTLFSTKKVIESVSLSAREVVFIKGRSTSQGNLTSDNLKETLAAADLSDIIAIGSGLSLDPSSTDLARSFISSYEGDLIIDGDALTAIRDSLDVLSSRKGATIITPHLGEFSVLTGLTVSEIISDRINIVKDFAERYRVHVVLKDAVTVITSPEGETIINSTGNNGLAVAGSGDILVGVLAATAVSVLSLHHACSMAVFLHGMAGDMLRDQVGEEGVTPTRLLEILPLAIKRFREDYSEVIESYSPELY